MHIPVRKAVNGRYPSAIPTDYPTSLSKHDPNILIIRSGRISQSDTPNIVNISIQHNPNLTTNHIWYIYKPLWKPNMSTSQELAEKAWRRCFGFHQGWKRKIVLVRWFNWWFNRFCFFHIAIVFSFYVHMFKRWSVHVGHEWFESYKHTSLKSSAQAAFWAPIDAQHELWGSLQAMGRLKDALFLEVRGLKASSFNQLKPIVPYCTIPSQFLGMKQYLCIDQVVKNDVSFFFDTPNSLDLVHVPCVSLVFLFMYCFLYHILLGVLQYLAIA